MSSARRAATSITCAFCDLLGLAHPERHATVASARTADFYVFSFLEYHDLGF